MLNNLNKEIKTVKINLSEIIEARNNNKINKLYDRNINCLVKKGYIEIHITANSKNYIIIADKISNDYLYIQINLDGNKNGNLIVINNQKYACDTRRENRGNGHAILIGSAEGNAWRLGEGNGHAIRTGSGYGGSHRYNEGNGNAIKSGSDGGNATRLGEGNGHSIRIGSGKGHASRYDEGHGHAIRLGTGEGDALRTKEGNGHAVRLKTGKGDAIKKINW